MRRQLVCCYSRMQMQTVQLEATIYQSSQQLHDKTYQQSKHQLRPEQIYMWGDMLVGQKTPGLRILAQDGLVTHLWRLRIFFCSRDCCLCAMHQSVKERRHAKKQRLNWETRPNQAKTKTPTKNPTQPKTPQPQEAFAASETSETAFTRNRWNMSYEAS